MNGQDKTKEELIKELQELQQENNSLKALYNKGITEHKQAEQDYISMIEKGGARMLNIINDLIDISKIESGLMEVFVSACNIYQSLCRDAWREALGNKRSRKRLNVLFYHTLQW